MGSIDILEEKEWNVLVTGFGPFKDQYPVNPSWEIAASLPDYLPWDRVKDSASSSSSSADTPALAGGAPPRPPRVRLLVHPEPIRVNYDVVRDLVPTFWDDPDRKIDFALHIGMAGPKPVVYSVEHRAHRSGYKMRDVDGNFLRDEERQKREGADWVWHGVPDELFTDVDIDDVYERWVARSPKDANLRISEDPGRYLCDFIYFSSQAHLYKQARPRKVLFLHVPADASAPSIQTGTDLAIRLIQSVVESELRGERQAARK